MFVGTVYGVLRRHWGKRASRGAFPELGRKLGLEHVAADTPGAAGVLKGVYDGYAVRIESEARARLVVRLKHEPMALDLRNYERWRRLPPSLSPFALGDPALNHWLRTRLAGALVAEAVASDAQLLACLRAFRGNQALREFTVAEGRIECVFDFGARALFPAAAAERALAEALRLAHSLDNVSTSTAS